MVGMTEEEYVAMTHDYLLNAARALKDAGVIREEGDRVSLQCGEDGGWVDGFDVKEIWIAKCDGPVEGWEILDRLTL